MAGILSNLTHSSSEILTTHDFISLTEGDQDGDDEVLDDTNSLTGGTGVRSSNAPSLGASRKGSMFDIAGLDQTHSPIPEEDGQR